MSFSRKIKKKSSFSIPKLKFSQPLVVITSWLHVSDMSCVSSETLAGSPADCFTSHQLLCYVP